MFASPLSDKVKQNTMSSPSPTAPKTALSCAELSAAAAQLPEFPTWPALTVDPDTYPADLAGLLLERPSPRAPAPPLPAFAPSPSADMSAFLSSAAEALRAALDAHAAHAAAQSAAADEEAAAWRAHPVAVAELATALSDALQDRRARWDAERAALDAHLERPRALLAATTAESALAARGVALARRRAAAAEAESASLAAAFAAERAAEDFGRLPRSALRLVAGFLRRREVAACVRVCRRWRYCLDRGFIWKEVLRGAVAETAARRVAAAESAEVAALAAMLPTAVTITLRDPHKKARHAGRAQVYETCLAQVRAQVEAVESEREDLFSNANTEEQVLSFLRDTLATERARYGAAIKERTAAERAQAEAETLKTQLMAELGELEAETAAEDAARCRADEAAAQSITALERTLAMVGEDAAAGNQTAGSTTAAVGGGGGGMLGDFLLGEPAVPAAGGSTNPFDDDFMGNAVAAGLQSPGPVGAGAAGGSGSGATLDELTQQMKQHKKLLVRAVKQLRSDVTTAKQANDQLEAQLRMLGIEPA